MSGINRAKKRAAKAKGKQSAAGTEAKAVATKVSANGKASSTASAEAPAGGLKRKGLQDERTRGNFRVRLSDGSSHGFKYTAETKDEVRLEAIRFLDEKEARFIDESEADSYTE